MSFRSLAGRRPRRVPVHWKRRSSADLLQLFAVRRELARSRRAGAGRPSRRARL